jgi:gas vesicle protein
MRFLLGLLLGAAVGFAATVLLAPDREEEDELGREHLADPDLAAAAGENHNLRGTVNRFMRSVQSQAEEAWKEAVAAAEEAEKEMWGHYERIARNKAGARK